MWAPRYGSIVDRFRAWATEDTAVRAALIVGSQARTVEPADEWSDLDLVIFHLYPDQLLGATDWFGRFGPVVLSMIEPTAVGGGRERRVLYEGGRDVDFSVFPAFSIPFLADNAEGASVLRRGFEVLLDKDGQLARLPSLLSATPVPGSGGPSEEEFDASVADFWYHVLWTAKKLRRGEIWIAKMACDGYLKRLLGRMIEWHSMADPAAEVRHEGRFLDRWAPASVRARLPGTFARYDRNDIARALLETGGLFSELARATAGNRGWVYPAETESAVRALVVGTLGDVRRSDRPRRTAPAPDRPPRDRRAARGTQA